MLLEKNRNYKSTVFMLMAILGAFFFAGAYSDEITSEELIKRAKLNDTQRRQEQEDLHKQIQDREYWLKLAELTHKNIQQLQTDTQALLDRMDVLMDSNDGRRIAHSENDFLMFVEMNTHLGVSLIEIEKNIEKASALVARVKQGGAKPDIGYSPNRETQVEIKDLYTWTQEKLKLMGQHNNDLSEMLRTASLDISDISKATSLRLELQRYRAKETRAKALGRSVGETRAEPDVKQIYDETHYLKRIKEAEAYAERTAAEYQVQLKKLKHDSELEITRLNMLMTRERADMDAKYENLELEIRRLKRSAAVQSQVADIDAGIATGEILDEAERRRRVAECESYKIQHLLAPLFAHSDYQPFHAKDNKKGPVSYKRLQQLAIFSDINPTALQNLWRVVTDPCDENRIRAPFSRRFDGMSSRHMDQLRQMRKYLEDLGPTLIELGYLAN